MVNIKTATIKEDLCQTCAKANGNGCPIWPPARITYSCVEYFKKDNNEHELNHDRTK